MYTTCGYSRNNKYLFGDLFLVPLAIPSSIQVHTDLFHTPIHSGTRLKSLISLHIMRFSTYPHC